MDSAAPLHVNCKSVLICNDDDDDDDGSSDLDESDSDSDEE